MKTNIFQSKGYKELLGALAGMTIAVVMYSVNNVLPSSQISKALLVDTSSPLSVSGANVRMNAKYPDPETYKRLVAKAEQVAKQFLTAGQTGTPQNIPSSAAITTTTPVSEVVANHSDRTAWMKMRETVRTKNIAFDLAVDHAAAEPQTQQVAVLGREQAG